jgi:hypothetical protein
VSFLVAWRCPDHQSEGKKMRDQLTRRQIGGAESRDLGVKGTAAVGNDPFFAKTLRHLAGAIFVVAVFSFLAVHATTAGSSATPIIPRQTSTIPSNQDVNPYGVAFVPDGFPTTNLTAPGDVLVSNFNNSTNTQGTGTTIVSISPDGTQTLFFQGKPPLGLTTALNALKKGIVIVGNVPNNMGTAEQGSLIVLDKNGNQLAGSPLVDSTFLDGPWDSTVIDNGDSAIVFVSCVLNGTVTRLELTFSGGSVNIKSKVTIASGYMFGPNMAAFVVGPTGLAYDPQDDVLYVASTEDNEIFAVPAATKATESCGTGTVIFNDQNHLHGPLALVLAPNGDLISSQGDAINQSSDPAQVSEIVEFTKGRRGKQGTFVSQFSIDSAVGAAFGIAINPKDNGAVEFAAVDDQVDTLTVYPLSGK